jgi:hypothetical protein
MHIIIGMPPHIIIMGMPAPIMLIMRWQHSLNISIDMPSPGMTLQVIMLPDISQLIFIIGTAIGIMPGIIGIMLFITGMPPIIGIIPGIIGMPDIIGIMPPIMGIMPDIIGMLAGMAPVDICVAVFMSIGSLLRCVCAPAWRRREFVAAVLKSRSRRAQLRSRRSLHFAPMK